VIEMARSNLVSISVSPPTVFQINITNTQNTATPVPFQQMIQLPISQLGLINPYVRNIGPLRFSYNGSYIPAWLESINNGTATIWVKLPVSIPANSSITIDMKVDPTLNFDGNYWGENPLLSSTYGQYDDGSNVFNFYDNFVGTTLNSKWTSGTSGGSYTVNNGLTITLPYNAASGSYVYVSTSSYTVTSAQIIESYANLNGFNTTNFRMVPVGLTQYNNVPWHADLYENENGVGWVGDAQSRGGISAIATTSSNANYFQTSLIDSTSSYQLWGILYPDNNSVSVQYNYSNWGSTTTYVPATPLYITISNYIYPSQNIIQTTYPINVYYIRARAYPPNGVMPSVEVIA